MKKLVVTTAIAIAGLLPLATNSFAWGDWGDGDDDGGGSRFRFGFGFGQRATNLTTVHINLFVLGQGGTNTSSSGVTTVHFKQSKLCDNDILGLINGEFGTSFSVTNGDHLAVSNFWSGNIMVLDRTNNILLDTGSNTNGDQFQLGFSSANTVFSSTGTTNCLTKCSVTDGFLTYQSGNGSNSFSLEGFTTVNDSYCHGLSNSMESFQLSGGIGSITGTNGVSGVLTGTACGSGKNNAPPLQ
jgi:hypothetical protein